MTSSLKRPSRVEQWLELFRGELSAEDAERLLGTSALWSVDGLKIGSRGEGRVIEDGPAWAPTRALRVVLIENRVLFDEWVRRWTDEDFLEDYDAACVLRSLERDELITKLMDGFAATMTSRFKP